MFFSHDSREFPSTPAFASAAAPSRWAQGRRNRRSPKGPQWGSGHPSRLAFCLRRNCDFVMANQQFRNQRFLIDVGPVLSSLSVQIFWIDLIMHLCAKTYIIGKINSEWLRIRPWITWAWDLQESLESHRRSSECYLDMKHFDCWPGPLGPLSHIV